MKNEGIAQRADTDSRDAGRTVEHAPARGLFAIGVSRNGASHSWSWPDAGVWKALYSCSLTEVGGCFRRDCVAVDGGSPPPVRPSPNAGELHVDGGSARSWTWTRQSDGYRANSTGTGAPSAGQEIILTAAGGEDLAAFTLSTLWPNDPMIVAPNAPAGVFAFSAADGMTFTLAPVPTAPVTIGLSSTAGPFMSLSCSFPPGTATATVSAAAIAGLSGRFHFGATSENTSTLSRDGWDLSFKADSVVLLPDAGWPSYVDIQ